MSRLARELAWMEQAACKDEPVETFFPRERTGRPPNAPTDHNHAYAHARTICAACPVFDACKSYEQANPADDGMWWGTTSRERKAARRGARLGRTIPAAPQTERETA